MPKLIMENIKDKEILNQMTDDNSSTASTAGDWVKELFAPIYDFEAIVSAGQNGYPKQSIIKKVPILDPIAIREVFERVHEKVVQAERQKQLEVQKAKEVKEDAKIDPRKSIVWNTDEIETLRKVYKAAKGEITKLEIALNEEKKINQTLKRTLKEQTSEITEIGNQLSDATKANHRLTIHRDHLQKENSVLDLKCAALKDSWIEIGKEKLKAMEALKEANLALDKERLLREKLEKDITEVKQNLIRDSALMERNITTKFEIEMNDLNEVIRDLSVELQEERKLHQASRRGLEHLRQHFTSLPLQDVLPPGAVLANQIDHIDHCSL